MADKRGIVISPPFVVLPEGGISCGGSPSSADLRKYLLYWDEIDYPDNNFVSIGADPDMEFLISAGSNSSPISGLNVIGKWGVLSLGSASGV